MHSVDYFLPLVIISLFFLLMVCFADGKSGKILPFIVADCFDDEALDRMLSHTKVVINAIGPVIFFFGKVYSQI